MYSTVAVGEAVMVQFGPGVTEGNTLEVGDGVMECVAVGLGVHVAKRLDDRETEGNATSRICPHQSSCCENDPVADWRSIQIRPPGYQDQLKGVLARAKALIDLHELAS